MISRHGITPGSYDISVESHDCTSRQERARGGCTCKGCARERITRTSDRTRKKVGYVSKPGTPVICLETEERFESMKEAMERYGVSSGSLNSALTYGYSTGGYHFYRADEPKPDDSFFKSGNGGKGFLQKAPGYLFGNRGSV